MNRQRILVVAFAALLVGGGAYMYTQRSAGAVKPAAAKSVATTTRGGKPTAPPLAKPKTASATTPIAPPRSSAAAAVPPTKSPAPAPVTASQSPAPAPVATPKAAGASTPMAATKSPAAPAPIATAVTPAPVAPALAASLPSASWQEQLQKGSYLADKLRSRLPEGTDVQVAANGFRDLQQFVATATAAHNLKLDFEELKRRVVTDRKGLASAIDAMKKVASATIEEQRAEYEARGLIQEARRQPAPAPPAVGARTAATKEQPKKLRTPSGS